MTGFVLLNDMKAEASWALLGLTCRLAQSLGLDRSPTAGRHGDTRFAPEGVDSAKALVPPTLTEPGRMLKLTPVTGGHVCGMTLSRPYHSIGRNAPSNRWAWED